MATLVLTAVGGLAGGPIGAALGGAIGQAVDRSILLRPKGRQGPRLTELAVQTSSYGRPIPRLYGRMRVAGQVIWATDLIEHRDGQSGGKGQPRVTTYAYSASFAVALSARAISGVGRIWADGNLLRGAAGDWKVVTGFRLHTGGEDQAPDPLIVSAEGAGLTPAHRGIAYAVFEDLPLETFGNRIPSLTFEVIADAGAVPVGRIARDIAPDVLTGDGPALPLDGFSAYGDSRRAVIETLAEASGAWFAPADGGIAMRDGGDASRTIVDDDPVWRIAPAARAPQGVVLSHYDPARDWQAGLQRVVRAGNGGPTLTVELPAALSAEAAKTAAAAMLMRAEAARMHRRVAADASAIDLAPGSVVAIAGEGGAWRVAATSIERFGVTLDLVALVPPVPPIRASGGRALREPDLRAGQTILYAFETAAIGEAAPTRPQVMVVAAGSGAGWRRAALQYSVDEGASWTAAGGTGAPGVCGTLATVLGAGSATLVDRDTAVEVTLAHAGMTLSNADAGALDRGANLALIGDELLQFAEAVPVGGARWRLRTLWRGRRGTAASGGAAGARFVLLDRASVVPLTIDVAIGAAVHVSASGAGDVAAAEVLCPVTGASVLPPAPVRLTGTRSGEGLTLQWRRRSRVDWQWRDGVDAALGEEREAYRVTITGASGTRSIDTNVPYLALADADAAGASVHVAVRQIGITGLSHAATIVL